MLSGTNVLSSRLVRVLNRLVMVFSFFGNAKCWFAVSSFNARDNFLLYKTDRAGHAVRAKEHIGLYLFVIPVDVHRQAERDEGRAW